MKKIVLSKFVLDLKEKFDFSQQEIEESIAKPDKSERRDALVFGIKYYSTYLYLSTAIEHEEYFEIVSSYKILFSLIESINPLVFKAITNSPPTDIQSISPLQLKEVFLETFALPIYIENVGSKKFYIDEKNKLIVEGVFDVDKYSGWINSSK